MDEKLINKVDKYLEFIPKYRVFKKWEINKMLNEKTLKWNGERWGYLIFNTDKKRKRYIQYQTPPKCYIDKLREQQNQEDGDEKQ